MPKMQALRTIYGDYGLVHEGQKFECDEHTALSLESRGLAARAQKPGILAKMMSRYENKMLEPAAETPPQVAIPQDAPQSPEPPVIEDVSNFAPLQSLRRRHARGR